MFSDLTGYTEMSEKLDPEEVKEITSAIFCELTKIIEKYDGFIEKYIGDAILAVFGAKEAFEDSALRAIKAAREIHTYVDSASPKYEEVIGHKLSMHTGINTGLVVTGEINYQKGTHGLVGDTINTAARLMSISQPGVIITDHDSYVQTKGYFEFNSLEPARVKGKAEPINVYQVGDALQVPKKLHRMHGRRANLIGRSIEMQILEDAAESLGQGKASVVSVCGTAGTGKSRLIHEFKKTLNLQKIQWFDGNAYPYTQNTSYYPLIDLLTKAFGIKEGDRTEVIREKIASTLNELICENWDKIPYICGLFAIEYSEINEVSPEYWKEQLFIAVNEILNAITASGPTVICLEDIHWSDPSFLELARSIIADRSGPILLICIYRPTISVFTDFEKRNLRINFKEIRLKELSPSETQRMVRSLLNSDTIPKNLQQLIHDNVDGNPFFVEELINSLIESKTLYENPGGWTFSGSIDDTVLSTNIQSVIAGRIDRLGTETKRILQEASVIGKAFLYDILQRISVIKDGLDKKLVMLERHDLISAKTLQPTIEYIFKHALTQEIVYNGLLKTERKKIHDKIGEVIELLFKDRISEFYESLSYHFERGTSASKAVNYLIKSGEKSLKRFSLDEAYAYYQKGYELLSNIGSKSKLEEHTLIELINKWGMVFYYTGNFYEFEQILYANENIAERAENKALTGMFLAWQGNVAWQREKLKKAYSYLKSAYEAGELSENDNVRAYALCWLSWVCADMGMFKDGIECGEQALTIAKKLKTDHYLYYKSIAGIGRNSLYMGHAVRSREVGEHLLEYGKKHSHIRSLVMGHWGIGDSHLANGDYKSASESYKNAYDVAVDPFYKFGSGVYRLVAYINDENFEIAKPLSIELTNYCKKTKWTHGDTIAGMIAGILAIEDGNWSKGLDEIMHKLQFCYEIERWGLVPIAEYTVGKIFLTIVLGERSVKSITLIKNLDFVFRNAIFANRRAEEYFQKSIETAKKIGADGIMGQALYGLGILSKKQKNTEKARDYFVKSMMAFESAGASLYFDLSKSELSLLDNIPR
jgi:class 3 adenylate cyclase/tetratricopeptide (TPR) repeat protein